MKLPRGVSADRLIRRWNKSDTRSGTLHGILAEVAFMRSTTIESISELL